MEENIQDIRQVNQTIKQESRPCQLIVLTHIIDVRVIYAHKVNMMGRPALSLSCPGVGEEGKKIFNVLGSC